MNIKKLRQAKTDELAKMQAIQTASSERDLTEEERTQLDASRAKLKTINADIERTEALMDEERNLPAGAAARAELPNEAKKPWTSLGEQLKAVSNNVRSQGRVTDPRLYAAGLGANETVEAEGGILIAPEYTSGILKRTYELAAIASRVVHMPMASNRLLMNAVDEDSRADGSRWGGVQSYYISEAGIYTGTKPKFKQLQYTANKLVVLVYATEEQLEDSTALEAYVNQVAPDEFAFKTDDAILNGVGAGQPLGVLNSGAAYSVAKESGQTAKTIVTANILNMWAREWGASRKTAVWLINQDVEPQLYTLAFANPTGAVLFTGPMYTPPGVNGNNSPYGLLMGRPVIPVEQCASLGTLGDIVLFDGQSYILAEKGGMRADTSIHVAFLTGEQAFRFMLRHDGQPTWKKPLTPKNGTNLLSPFVTLATRA